MATADNNRFSYVQSDEVEEKLVVIPEPLRQKFLREAYDYAGHPSLDRTLARLMQTAYWVDMSNEIGH